MHACMRACWRAAARARACVCRAVDLRMSVRNGAACVHVRSVPRAAAPWRGRTTHNAGLRAHTIARTRAHRAPCANAPRIRETRSPRRLSRGCVWAHTTRWAHRGNRSSSRLQRRRLLPPLPLLLRSRRSRHRCGACCGVSTEGTCPLAKSGRLPAICSAIGCSSALPRSPADRRGR